MVTGNKNPVLPFIHIIIAAEILVGAVSKGRLFIVTKNFLKKFFAKKNFFKRKKIPLYWALIYNSKIFCCYVYKLQSQNELSN